MCKGSGLQRLHVVLHPLRGTYLREPSSFWTRGVYTLRIAARACHRTKLLAAQFKLEAVSLCFYPRYAEVILCTEMHIVDGPQNLRSGFAALQQGFP